MVNGIIARGTTPAIAFPLPDDLLVSELNQFSIVFRQKNKNVLKYTKDNMVQLPGIDEEKNITIVMSQEETFQLNPKISTVEVQIKAASTGNDVFVVGDYSFRIVDCFDGEAFDLTK